MVEDMLWGSAARNTEECALLSKLGGQVPTIVTDVHGCIIGVSTSWVTMCEYTLEEALGERPTILHGPLTNQESALDFSMQLRVRPAFGTVVNYKKSGTVFVNHLYGWALGDILVAETYAEDTVQH